jgi:hypothetical protein
MRITPQEFLFWFLINSFLANILRFLTLVELRKVNHINDFERNQIHILNKKAFTKKEKVPKDDPTSEEYWPKFT